MLFGLSNALAIFQGYVNKILAEKLDIYIIIYLDDILIYTKDSGQPYVEAVCWALAQLRKYLLFANLKKCCFHQDEVCFLRYRKRAIFSKLRHNDLTEQNNGQRWPNNNNDSSKYDELDNDNDW